MSPSQQVSRNLIKLLLEAGVLTFGEFTLKSGRISPYFMNFGKICTGKASSFLGCYYASCILDNLSGKFDVVFGPAYKGIALASQAASSIAESGVEVGWSYNRKEAKDHGEGGIAVGAPLAGKRVVIVDDVITAGTALGEAVEIIRKAGGEVVAAMVAFDRMEKGKEGDSSAVQEAREKYGFPVYSIANLEDLLAYLKDVPAESGDDEVGELIVRIEAYREKYGADYGVAAAVPS